MTSEQWSSSFHSFLHKIVISFFLGLNVIITKTTKEEHKFNVVTEIDFIWSNFSPKVQAVWSTVWPNAYIFHPVGLSLQPVLLFWNDRHLRAVMQRGTGKDLVWVDQYSLPDSGERVADNRTSERRKTQVRKGSTTKNTFMHSAGDRKYLLQERLLPSEDHEKQLKHVTVASVSGWKRRNNVCRSDWQWSTIDCRDRLDFRHRIRRFSVVTDRL